MSGIDRLHALYPNIPVHEWARGACGIGFLANNDGVPTRDVVRQAIDACGCLTHRGAETRRDAGDAGTSDGAGILFSIHAPFFADAFAVPLPADPHPFGLGMFFLPTEPEQAAAVKELILRCCRRSGMEVLGWREPEVNREILGARARETCPLVAQVLIRRPDDLDVDAFEARLFRVRKRIERAAERVRLRLHIPSFSAFSVVYKGLFRATQVAEFYHADLGSDRFLAAVAVYHQRYATNTLPDWALAQPFRRLCHNGEINTLLGNRTWTAARERALSPHMRRRLTPILGSAANSDSAQLDRLVEAITLCGVSPVQAMLGVVPEAAEAVPEMHEGLRAWYRMQQATREPWDGPAGLIYYDGHWLIAHLDRNGLRPLFVQETGGYGGPRQVIVASEQGVTEWPGEDVIYTGQLGPGELIAVDMESGRCYHDKEIKAELIALAGDWQAAAERLISVGGTDPYRRPALDEEAFTRVQIAAGATQDDLTYFLIPMVREGKEAVWSMGDDSQLAPYVERPRMLEDHLRQRFAQVTNPPIDPYREGLVFSTKIYLGKLDGFFGEPPSGQSIELTSPILSGPRFSWIMRQDGVEHLTTRFPVGDRDGTPSAQPLAAFERALTALEESALAAVREGARVLVLSDRMPRGQYYGGNGKSAISGANGAGSLLASDPKVLVPAIDAEYAAMPMLLVVARVHRRLLEAGLRTRVGLVVDTASAWHEHHIACQLGFGADAVHPWMALEWAWRISECEEGCTPDPQGDRFRKVLHKGVIKVMSKMGICASTSYTGAGLFEVLGLDAQVIARFFPDAARFLIHAMASMLQQAHTVPGHAAASVATEIRQRRLLGVDIDPWITTIGKMNMYIHGDGKSNVRNGNGLALSTAKTFAPERSGTLEGAVDVVLTNPPLGDLNFHEVGLELARTGLLGAGDQGMLANTWSSRTLAVVPHRCKEEDDKEEFLRSKQQWQERRDTALLANDTKAKTRAERQMSELDGKIAALDQRIGSGQLTWVPSGATAKGGALFLSAIKDYLTMRRDQTLPEEWRGGVVGIVLDEAILNTAEYGIARAFLRRHFFIKAIISLPRDAFAYVARTTAKTTILVLTRKPDPDVLQREPIFFAGAKLIGYTASGRPAPNDLLDIVKSFNDWRTAVLSSYGGQPTRLDPSRLEVLGAGLPSSTVPFWSYPLDPSDVTSRLDLPYHRMRDEIRKMVRHQSLADLIEPIVRTPADHPAYAFATITSTDGRVRPKGGEETTSYPPSDLREIREGDILLSGIDLVSGSIGVVAKDCNGLVVSKEFYTLRVRAEAADQVLPEFLVAVLRSSTMRVIIEGLVTGTSNRTRADFAAFLQLPLPALPKREIQQRYAETMHHAFELQDESVRQIVALREGIEQDFWQPGRQ